MGEEEAEVGFGGSFMELLGFARNVVTQNREESKPIELDQDQGFLFSPAACINHTSSSSSSTSSSSSYPHMLHFGGGHEDFFLLNNDDASIFIEKGRSRARTQKVDGNGGGRDNTVVASRKPKAGSTTIKVRKEKIGDKISALQQLVSPFGKTDTATVLHEAFGYIRFLHDQVQVLTSAYLQQTGEQGVELREGDLRSRGLCLVPVSFTGNMTNTSNSSSDIIKNGADLWSPAAALGGGGSSSS